VAIVWGDNYMTDTQSFFSMLHASETILDSGTANIILIGEQPRFANSNLGWIGLGARKGEAAGQSYYECTSWVYRPPLDECQRMFESGDYAWNTGYFVTTAGFIMSAYDEHQPGLSEGLRTIGEAIGTPEYNNRLQAVYPRLEEVHFDDAIVKKIGREHGVVLCGSTGWSDPGTLYALKESIDPDPRENVTKGLVRTLSSEDCLLYNYEEGKLLAVAGLEGMIVVNTPDAIVVVHKDDIRLVKELVDSLVGTELEKFS
jgi:mannose-1-phosphate guanylyltransferase